MVLRYKYFDLYDLFAIIDNPRKTIVIVYTGAPGCFAVGDARGQ